MLDKKIQELTNKIQKLTNDINFNRNLYLEAEQDNDATTMFVAKVRLKELEEQVDKLL